MSDQPPLDILDLLDDEPPPERRRAAEAAAASDPALAEELRSISAVRDLVAGLSRPSPPDLSGAVLRRIAARRRARLASRAAAAVVLLAGGLAAYSVARPRPTPPAATPAIAPPVVASIAAPPLPSPEPVAEVAATPASVPVATREFVGPPDDRPLIARRLLERAGPVRLLLANRGRPADAAELAEVARLVGLSSRRDFHRFDLPAADGRPGAAVFAAELDPGELKTLRMRLADAFPDGLVEQESGPPLLAELGRAGTATTLRGDPAAEILMPRREMALRVPGEAPATADEAPPPPAIGPDADPKEAEGSSVLLIWLPAAGG
ncbi:hypothetical protein [Paludisphaera sp.]|uniref:hypothetical protein n=1 Tax=Paludisphaera sp. TaxID=2017432 RepID=UPI00301DEE8E